MSSPRSRAARIIAIDMRALVSIGLPGTLPEPTIATLAPRIERLGFHGLWLNDTPGGDSLAGVRAAAEVTTTLHLGTGVIPVDRRPASGLELHGLPRNRLTLGIGAGGAPGGIGRATAAIDHLAAATDARLVLGALGPRMRRIAAERTDGVLLNWLTPSAAVDAVHALRRDAHGREVRAILYVRTIVEEEAAPALDQEARRYAGIRSYADNFRRLGIEPFDATIRGRQQLEPYREAVDELVLRAITANGSLGELEGFAERAASWLE